MVSLSLQLPTSLEALLTEKFFNSCLIHQESKKNEKNVFCFDCCRGICSHCLPCHPSHRLLQIRRYVYHNVIRLEDADQLVDCDLVQYYSTNNARVVFLNQRRQSRLCRGGANFCLTCDRTLQNTFLFCSVFCKYRHIPTTTDDNNLSNHIMESNSVVALSEHGVDIGLNTPMSVLEVVGGETTNSSGSSGCQAAACTDAASSDVVRKKRSSVSVLREACRNISSIPVSSEIPVVEIVRNRRRKGIPHRAPFY